MLNIRLKLCEQSLGHSYFLRYYRPEKKNGETLIVKTICIWGNTGNIHIRGIFFWVFMGAYYNRCLWIYKITRLSYCFGDGWVVVVVVVGVRGGVWCKVLNVSSRGGCQNRSSANKGAGGGCPLRQNPVANYIDQIFSEFNTLDTNEC